ncbi:hypothetical protein G6F59_018541 [Rhizopus arrhizus]|nr:hypothetical protein G6F59_018541 [Rhizopus arrhizus]
MAQKPPMATPISARPSMNTGKLGARAASVPERIIAVWRDQQAGNKGERAGHRNGLSGLAFTDPQVGGDGCQQADRHELGGNHGKGAE